MTALQQYVAQVDISGEHGNLGGWWEQGEPGVVLPAVGDSE